MGSIARVSKDFPKELRTEIYETAMPRGTAMHTVAPPYMRLFRIAPTIVSVVAPPENSERYASRDGKDIGFLTPDNDRAKIEASGSTTKITMKIRYA
jgi:hypothetical protein